jgi:hypothetical protein
MSWFLKDTALETTAVMLCLWRAFFVWRGSAVLGAVRVLGANFPSLRGRHILLFHGPLFPQQERAPPLDPTFNLSFASMASNSKEKKDRKHGDTPTVKPIRV